MIGRVLLSMVFLVVSVQAQDWSGFRGPRGDGVAASKNVPVRWDRKTNVKWRTPLPRPANGSPVVVGGRVFLTVAEDDEGRGRSLRCYDAGTGEQSWARTVSIDKTMPTHKTNPYCGTTPACDGERVVVWHGSAGLHCYQVDGTHCWSQDLGEFRHYWGYGTSPVLHDGMVILNTGPGAAPFVAAFDLTSGELLWKTPEPDLRPKGEPGTRRLWGSWSTPVITRQADQDILICPQPTRIVAYDVKSGEILWWCQGLSCERGDLAYSSPVIAGGVCLVRGGYVGPSIGVRLGGSGDVTETHRVWRLPKQKSNVGSGVAVDGRVYMPDMDSFVTCVDAKTGERLWTERAGRGDCWGSVVEAEGRLYLMNQRGDTVVFRPDSKGLQVVARNSLGEETNSTPAFTDGHVFLRTHESLYCIARPR